MSKANKVSAKMYDTLKRPVITEKSMVASELGKATFVIPNTATKSDVKKAVEALFNVTVKSVNTICQNGKVKRFRGHEGKRNDYKKAVVTLAEGQNIDITTGL